MIVRLLVHHMEGNYPGEYLPEIATATDEGVLEANPEWWADEIERQKDDSGRDQAWAEVDIEVNEDDLMSILYPNHTPLKVTIVRPVSAS